MARREELAFTLCIAEQRFHHPTAPIDELFCLRCCSACGHNGMSWDERLAVTDAVLRYLELASKTNPSASEAEGSVARSADRPVDETADARKALEGQHEAVKAGD